MKTGRRNMGKIAVALAVVCAAIAGAVPAGIAANAATKTTRVAVTETDYKISLSKHAFKAGRVTFVVVNRGKVAHEFAIRGPGVNKRIPGKLVPGSKKTLSVRLRKGKYTINCPIHVALGMKTTIRVR